MDSATSTLCTGPFATEGLFCWFLLLPCFTEIPLFNANSVDPDEMWQNAASDLGLHCLLLSFLRDTRSKLVDCI